MKNDTIYDPSLHGKMVLPLIGIHFSRFFRGCQCAYVIFFAVNDLDNVKHITWLILQLLHSCRSPPVAKQALPPSHIFP